MRLNRMAAQQRGPTMSLRARPFSQNINEFKLHQSARLLHYKCHSMTTDSFIKKIQILFLAACLVACFTGCSKNETPGSADNANPAVKKLKLAFIPNSSANFWTIARVGCNDAAKELGDVDVDFRIPSSGGAAEQQSILNDLVAAGGLT